MSDCIITRRDRVEDVGTSEIGWRICNVCAGDTHINAHSDCELSSSLSLSDVVVSSHITGLSYYDRLDAIFQLDQATITTGTVLTIQTKSSAYRYDNGQGQATSITVRDVGYMDTVDSESSDWDRIPSEYMTINRNKSKADSCTDTVSFSTYSFPNVCAGGYVRSISMSSESIVTAGGLVIKINNRDAALYSNWKEERSMGANGSFIKIRWLGMSNYSSSSADMEYEIVYFSNGDVLIHIIKAGANSGTCTFKGIGITVSRSTPYISCYRQNMAGSSWNIVYGAYDYSLHTTDAEWIMHSREFATECSNVSNGLALLYNSKNDDGTVTGNFLYGFTWHGYTYCVCSGNSWIGIGSSSEDVKMGRRDAAMYTIYNDQVILSDMNNLQAMHITWIGYSAYSGSVDRYWSLWLFENGDAMIYIRSVGSSGTNSFFGRSYTASANSYISFYYNGTDYDLYYEIYTLEHHYDDI